MEYRVAQIKNITDSSHHLIFSQVFRSIERRITPRMGWSDRNNPHDISGIVFDRNQRLIMEPGETFTCLINWNPLNKANKAERPVIMLGTPYGVVVLTYPVELKKGSQFSAFSNLDQAQVYATDNFWGAANRFSVLNPIMMSQVPGWKITDGFRGKVLEKFVKFWLLTSNFHADIQSQAELDLRTSFPVGDGIPLIERVKVEPKQQYPKRAAANMKANHNRRRQAARNAVNNPQLEQA